LDYNNAWLIEAFEALMEVEGKFLNAMVSEMEAQTGGVATRNWRRDELPQAHEQAIRAAQRLADLVERIKAEQDGSPPDLNPIP
jgi:predicted secreted Zn-dependent protease